MRREAPAWSESGHPCHERAVENLGRVRTTQNRPENRYGEGGAGEDSNHNAPKRSPKVRGLSENHQRVGVRKASTAIEHEYDEDR